MKHHPMRSSFGPWLILSMVFLLPACAAPSTGFWLGQLKDEDVIKRRQAIRELTPRTAESEQIVPALCQALHDENGYVRRDAAIALAQFGPAAHDAIPALTSALTDKEQNVRRAAGTALKIIDPQALSARSQR